MCENSGFLIRELIIGSGEQEHFPLWAENLKTLYAI